MKPKIIYIIGDNRSGSTLLDYLLACHSRAVSVGELHNLYEFYYKKGPTSKFWQHKCSCGELVQRCNFWKDILDQVKFSETFETRIHRLEPKWSFLHKSIHENAITKITNNEKLVEKGGLAARNCWKIYQAIFKKTKKDIIIDSSKNAFHAFSLFKNANSDIYFLVLERDIMAVSYSKENRLKGRGHQRSIYTHLVSSYKVLWRNRFLARIIRNANGRVKTINYFDLTNDPQKVITNICEFVEIEPFTLPSTTNSNKSEQHVIGGSPSRYLKSSIRPDERWKSYFKRKPFAYLIGSILKNL